MAHVKSSAAAIVLGAFLEEGCAGRIAPVWTPSMSVAISELWEDPADLPARDLFHGPGGEALAPGPATPFKFVKADRGGHSPGFDLEGPDGVRWSAKLGSEAQPEVAVSRILWAVGYHQVPTYYLATWTMTGGPSGSPGPARFRPEQPDRKVIGDWSWFENEFVGTQPFRGLVAVNLLLNAWDWKTSNNKIYEVQTPDGPRRIYVVRDLGASLGKTSYPKIMSWLPMRGLGQGSRNNIEDFEERGFIKRVEGDRVEFFYRGIYDSLVDTVTKDDVVWACRLLARLSDEQWNDAFRAAGYPPEPAGRYIAKIKSKIDEGLKLGNP
jgi:hypothetical protein